MSSPPSNVFIHHLPQERHFCPFPGLPDWIARPKAGGSPFHPHPRQAASCAPGNFRIRHCAKQSQLLRGPKLRIRCAGNTELAPARMNAGQRAADLAGDDRVKLLAEHCIFPSLPGHEGPQHPPTPPPLAFPSAKNSLDFAHRLGSQVFSGVVNERLFGRLCHFRYNYGIWEKAISHPASAGQSKMSQKASQARGWKPAKQPDKPKKSRFSEEVSQAKIGEPSEKREATRNNRHENGDQKSACKRRRLLNGC